MSRFHIFHKDSWVQIVKDWLRWSLSYLSFLPVGILLTSRQEYTELTHGHVWYFSEVKETRRGVNTWLEWAVALV